MIPGSEKETSPITAFESKRVQPKLIRILWTTWGRKNGLQGEAICRLINKELQEEGNTDKYKLSTPRLRKIVAFIHTKEIIPNICARGRNGYYRTNDIEELEEYEESLSCRSWSIIARQKAVRNYIQKLKGGSPQ